MRHNLFAGAALAALMVPASVQAQQITSGIQGVVRDEAGAPLPNARVVITDTRTGTERVVTTGPEGSFQADNLVTGGPYTIAASAEGFEGQTVRDVVINLQGDTSLTFTLTSGAGDIVVTAQRARLSQLAVGPGQSFGVEDLQNFPSITRDVRDIIRFDPRVRLDRANEVDRISCLGGNDRSNTFTVDGTIQSDAYGLNGTPFAARNALPLPFDSIRETSVEFAPFDVQYGQFTGCAINVVTKSGGNRLSGSAFYTFTSDDLVGKTLDGEEFPSIAFNERRWGATISGPIIRDRLFFFAGYEETDLGDSQDLGPIGGGFPNEQDFITVQQFDEVSSIIRDLYGIDSGGIARDLTERSRRFFGRADWYITTTTGSRRPTSGSRKRMSSRTASTIRSRPESTPSSSRAPSQIIMPAGSILPGATISPPRSGSATPRFRTFRAPSAAARPSPATPFRALSSGSTTMARPAAFWPDRVSRGHPTTC